MKNAITLMQERLSSLNDMLQKKPNILFIQSQEEEEEEEEEEDTRLSKLAMAAAKAELKPKAKPKDKTKRTPVIANSKLGKELNPRTTR